MLGVVPEHLQILGATYKEACSLHDVVLRAAEEHGERNVICIFDQNMDSYGLTKTVLGTDVVASLRDAGFKGAIFIRSANNSVLDEERYRKAGATSCLSKKGNTKVFAAALEAFDIHPALSVGFASVLMLLNVGLTALAFRCCAQNWCPSTNSGIFLVLFHSCVGVVLRVVIIPHAQWHAHCIWPTPLYDAQHAHAMRHLFTPALWDGKRNFNYNRHHTMAL